MPEKRPVIVSVVSGKGGTGKTLLTAVLGRALAREGARVLLVDLDIFVRGLTILLAEYTRRAPATSLTVVDLLSEPQAAANEQVAARFFECDVLPATRDIGEAVDYDEFVFTQGSFRKTFTSRLMTISEGYDIVLLDCRAGIDSLVIETAAMSTLVLSIAEDDDVCLQANTNLINYLRFKVNLRRVFTIINKARRVHSYADLRNRSKLRPDYNYVGVIPFDIEVMQDFGKDRFWTTVYETLYFRGLIDAWNNLAERGEMQTITESKYRFPARIFMSRSGGRLPLMQRMLRFYGLLLTISGIGYLFYTNFLEGLKRDQLWILVMITVGLLTIFASSANIREWLLGIADAPSDEPHDRHSD